MCRYLICLPLTKVATWLLTDVSLLLCIKIHFFGSECYFRGFLRKSSPVRQKQVRSTECQDFFLSVALRRASTRATRQPWAHACAMLAPARQLSARTTIPSWLAPCPPSQGGGGARSDFGRARGLSGGGELELKLNFSLREWGEGVDVLRLSTGLSSFLVDQSFCLYFSWLSSRAAVPAIVSECSSLETYFKR